MTNAPGARRQKFEAEFTDAMRGVGLAAIKKVLRAEIPSAVFGEVTKAALAARYATGKMSLGGSQEAQAFRRMDVSAVGCAARDVSAAKRLSL